MKCPACRVELEKTQTPTGVVYHCPRCRGQAVALAVLRRLGSKEAVQRLWNLAKDARPGCVKCPVCDGRMTQAALPVGAATPVLLDICAACQFAWLDHGEQEKFPPPDPSPDEESLSPAAREAIALRQVQVLADQAEREERAEEAGRPHSWHVLAHLLMIPFK